METRTKGHLDIFMATIKRIITSVDLDETISVITRGASQLVRSETGSLMLIDPERKEFYFSEDVGKKGEILREVRIPLDQGIAGNVVSSGQSMIINQARKDPHLCRDLDLMNRFSPRNLICVPLTVEDTVIGVLSVYDKKRKERFTEADLETLKSFSEFAALAINQRRLYQQMENKTYEISVLYLLSGSINYCGSIDELLQENVRIVCEAFQADRVSMIAREGEGYAIRASVGFPEAVLKDRKVTINGNVLGYMLRTGSGVYSPNIREDDRFERNHSHNYRGTSFVAAPLKHKNKILAFLCVTESKRKTPYQQSDLYFLEMIARQIMDNYNHSLLTEESKQKQKMEHELFIAARMQQDILPQDFPSADGLEIAARNIPAKYIGGDFYDYIPLGGGRYAAVIADISGKGVSAGLFMAMSRSIIRGHFAHTHSPSKVLDLANKHICVDSRAGMFVTCFCCVVDTEGKEITYANAGHNEQYLYKNQTRKIVPLKARLNISLGIVPDVVYREKTLRYEAGDILLFYTDGVTEAVNAKCKQYGEKRLKLKLRGAGASSSKDIIHLLIDDIKKHQGESEPSDDITLMVISVKDSQPLALRLAPNQALISQEKIP